MAWKRLTLVRKALSGAFDLSGTSGDRETLIASDDSDDTIIASEDDDDSDILTHRKVRFQFQWPMR